MNASNPSFGRRSLRLKQYDYTAAGAYFLTVCRGEDAISFGSLSEGSVELNDAGLMIVEEWCGLEERFEGLELDAFVVMPDHIHGIVVLDGSAAASRDPSASARGVYRCGTSVPRIMQAFKSLTTKRYREIAATGLRAYERRLWQRNYYEHVVRSEAELRAIREYIALNPAKADDRAHGLW